MNEDALVYDVVVVGAGPAGLACAIRLAQQAKKDNKEITIALLEKGSEIGAHILSGAVLDPKAIDELYPEWKDHVKDAVPVKNDEVKLLTKNSALPIPALLAPTMQNHGNYIVSLGNVCRALGEYAESLEVELYPGFSVSELLYNDKGAVCGVKTQDMGRNKDGEESSQFEPGVEIYAKAVVLSEGCRGSLGKALIEKFDLAKGKDPQHYGLGMKEIWRVSDEVHQPGLVIHTTGWPAQSDVVSGSFIYHGADNQVFLGYVVPLSYSNPHTFPFEEFQQWKHHPEVSKYLKGAERISYGARALIKGGPQSRPTMHFPGGLLIGDDAGTLNFARIKGSHTAMKSGIVAADTILEALNEEAIDQQVLASYDAKFEQSWAGKELHQNRNFGAWLHKFGAIIGAGLAWVDGFLLQGKLPITLSDSTPDHATLKDADQCKVIEYPKPDNVISFDRLSSVYISNTNHEENQPCHLHLKDGAIPIAVNLPKWNEPAQRYCPAGVYEVQQEEGKEAKFVINGQNCVHCKTCDIKDPSQNIEWKVPEGAGGPNYPNM